MELFIARNCAVREILPFTCIDILLWTRLCLSVQDSDLYVEFPAAFFDMYIGDVPVSEQAKEEIGRNVASIIRRC